MTTEQLDFEPLNLSEIQQESERVNQEETKGSDDYLAKFVKLPERDGYVNMRFLPKLRGKKLYCATKIHYLDDGTGTGKTKVYHSPKKLEFNDKGQPRWIGESVIDLFLRDLWSRSEKANEKDRKEMRRLYSRTKGVERYYYWVIVREEKDAEVVSFSMPVVKLSSNNTSDGEMGITRDHSFTALLNSNTNTGLVESTLLIQDTSL